MSRFFSEKYLRYRNLDFNLGPRTISEDRPCRRCSYNLRGLTSDRACPECGTPIAPERPVGYSSLSDAPLAEIVQLRRGLWLSMACLLAVPLVFYFAAVTEWRAGNGAAVITGGFTLITLGWAVAVWMMLPELQTAEAVRRGFAPGSWMRWAARLTQMTWPLAMLLIGFVPGAGTTWWTLLLASLHFVGIIGLWPLCVMLSRLADWCCDDTADRLLNITLWGLPLSTGVFLTMPFISVLRFFVCMTSALWVTAIGTYLLALLSLTASVSWSVKHAKERMDRELRARERVQRAVANAPAPRDDVIPLADGPAPLAQPNVFDHGPSTAFRSETVEEDAECDTCGYNLRGLKTYGRCPECGERVADSYIPT